MFPFNFQFSGNNSGFYFLTETVRLCYTRESTRSSEVTNIILINSGFNRSISLKFQHEAGL